MSSSSIAGIDVSHHNGTVDWAAVARAGIAFAYAKASEGVNMEDGQFSANYAGMKGNRLLRGAYHFFHPGSDASAQAANFLKVVPRLEPGDLPPALDVEVSDGQVASAIAARVRTWLQTVEAALGRTPMIYTSASFWNGNLAGSTGFERHPLWVAHYTMHPQPHLPAGFDRYAVWQYSESGTVTGVTGTVDLDRFDGTMDDLRALAGA
jgi:lysozyme